MKVVGGGVIGGASEVRVREATSVILTDQCHPLHNVQNLQRFAYASISLGKQCSPIKKIKNIFAAQLFHA